MHHEVLLLCTPFTEERAGKVLEWIGQQRYVGDMLTSTQVWLSMNIFRNISKKQIDRPELCSTEICELGAVGPDHKDHQNLLHLAGRFIRRKRSALDIVMFVNANIRVVDLREYSLFFATWRPVKQLERGEMEVGAKG